MNEGLIARRYAKALLMYGEEHGVDKVLYEESKIIERNFLEHPTLARTLLSPVVTFKEKVDLLAAAGEVSPSSAVVRFMRLIIHNHREAYIRTIFLSYQKLYRRRHHILLLTLTTAVGLSWEMIHKIQHLVQERVHDLEVEFRYRTDPAIIGGFILQYGTMRMDQSVAGELRKLKQNLVQEKSA